jgi:hypothetical protein
MNLLQIHTIEQDGSVGTISNKFKKFWSLIGFETLVWILGLAYLLLFTLPEKLTLQYVLYQILVLNFVLAVVWEIQFLIFSEVNLLHHFTLTH